MISTHALLKEWHEKHWRDIENYGITEEMAADFQSACAAGPWRTDVENAPREQALWGNWPDSYGLRSFIRRHNFWLVDGGTETYIAPDAFAVPNPPQVTT